MRKFLTFLLGMAVGALLCFAVLFYMGTSTGEEGDNGIPGLTLFEQPGESISTKPFKVIQVDNYGNALAMEKGNYNTVDIYDGVLVLFLAEDNVSYYDDQIIKIPSGSCVKQLGTYRYQSNMGHMKTLPAVAIRNK